MISKIMAYFGIFFSAVLGFLLAMFLFKKKSEIKTMTGYENEKVKTINKIKRKTLEEKVKEAKKYFGILTFAILLISCQGRDLLIIPEKPKTPKINFQVEKEKVFISERDFTELLIYLELSENYDLKFEKFLESLRK